MELWTTGGNWGWIMEPPHLSTTRMAHPPITPSGRPHRGSSRDQAKAALSPEPTALTTTAVHFSSLKNKETRDVDKWTANGQPNRQWTLVNLADPDAALSGNALRWNSREDSHPLFATHGSRAGPTRVADPGRRTTYSEQDPTFSASRNDGWTERTSMKIRVER